VLHDSKCVIKDEVIVKKSSWGSFKKNAIVLSQNRQFALRRGMQCGERGRLLQCWSRQQMLLVLSCVVYSLQ
jgi:hypothetical protein